MAPPIFRDWEMWEMWEMAVDEGSWKECSWYRECGSVALGPLNLKGGERK